MTKIVFWVSACFVLYAYAGYPVAVWLLSRLVPDKRRAHGTGRLPLVSLLISAYNEEDVIEDKITNSLSLTYPRELMEIVVVSDGSDDRTDAIVASYAKHGVVLKRFEGRIGKTACLNAVVPSLRGEVVIFSDANSLYEKNAVTNLVSNFGDPQVGFVTGHTKYREEKDSDVSATVGTYAVLEKFTKMAESRLSSCVGADGAIFGIRKHLYRPLNDTDINDFVIPLRIVQQGYRGVLEEEAWCVERTAGDQAGEFRRQLRITNRTLRAIFRNAGLLNPFRYGLFSFQLFSHKIARFLTPVPLVLLIVCNIALVRVGAIYGIAMVLQTAFFLLAWFGYQGWRFKAFPALVSLSYTFVTNNLAITAGWLHFIKGKTYTTWAPVKR